MKRYPKHKADKDYDASLTYEQGTKFKLFCPLCILKFETRSLLKAHFVENYVVM
jgi:hypothetical protein